MLKTCVRISQEPLGCVRMCANAKIVTRPRSLEHRLDHRLPQRAQGSAEAQLRAAIAATELSCQFHCEAAFLIVGYKNNGSTPRALSHVVIGIAQQRSRDGGPCPGVPEVGLDRATSYERVNETWVGV